ncbi:hypothetical protein O0I10_012450 [Lichtheimia ornata]|uniref:Uncharacterized protein n=1 Tax=Lichtheimia ornata TaxID=688661 RepID=A0AAD7URT9_9FUNG|nr:uncharacterized protein O0I10_012450 [Lichtheimia ornata]KAJ8651961.1 hypothetical protein O0I10_012450 [Lichtheimia ornata]
MVTIMRILIIVSWAAPDFRHWYLSPHLYFLSKLHAWRLRIQRKRDITESCGSLHAANNLVFNVLTVPSERSIRGYWRHWQLTILDLIHQVILKTNTQFLVLDMADSQS